MTATRLMGADRWPEGMKWALAASILLHVSFFALGSYMTRPRQVEGRLEYIETRLVRWAPQERPKDRLPHKDITPPQSGDKAPSLTTKPPENFPDQSPKMVPDDKAGEKEDYRDRINEILKRHQKTAKTTYDPDGAPDGSVNGTLSPGAQQILANAYLAQVSELFRAHWEIPAIIGPEDLAKLKCTVEFRVDGNGVILDVKMRTPSGDHRFDASALAAVRRTGTVPLPSHPQFKRQVLDYGMFYTFIPEEGR